MTPEQEAALQYHSREIAKILYEDSNTQEVQTLEGIEKTVRAQTLEHVTPQIGFFLSKTQQGQH